MSSVFIVIVVYLVNELIVSLHRRMVWYGVH